MTARTRLPGMRRPPRRLPRTRHGWRPERALQVHGAIGYTDELDLQLWLKRIWSLLGQWGTAGQHRAVVLASVAGSGRPPRFPEERWGAGRA